MVKPLISTNLAAAGINNN